MSELNVDISYFSKYSLKLVDSKNLLWFTDKNYIRVYNFDLVASSLESEHISFKFSISPIFLSSYTKRLFRYDVFHIFELDDNLYSIFLPYVVLFYDFSSFKIVGRYQLPFRRPLSACVIGDKVFFGDYNSNTHSLPVGLYSISLYNGLSLEYLFHDIRHIHSVSRFSSSKLLISTGDSDSESGLFLFDINLNSIKIITSGSQQTRVVLPSIVDNIIYYGSDTPHEPNNLYSLSISSDVQTLSLISSVPNSVFYSLALKNFIIFSTACEPSVCNDMTNAHVFSYDKRDGSFSHISSFKKDFLPSRFFQYGQISLVSISSSSDNFFLTPLSTIHSGRTFLVKLS